MSILMVSPEGAQSQCSTTEAEYLKTLGWKERSWDDFYGKKPAAPVAETVESATIEAPVVQRRMGRPRKE